MTNIKNKNITYRVLGLLSAGVIFVLSIYFLKNSEQSNLVIKENDTQITFNDRYSGFQTDTKISKIIISQDFENADSFTVKNDEPITRNIIKNYKNLDKYNLEYQVIAPNDKYVDVSLMIDQKKITTKLSGLTRHNKVSFKINEKTYVEEVPVDWSGKIIFEAPNTSNADQTFFCLDILDIDLNAKSICHALLQEGETV